MANYRLNMLRLFSLGVLASCGYGYVQVGEDEGSGLSSQQLTCNDSPPSADYSCEQQKGWGKCNEWWMKGHCESACGVCSNTCNNSPPSTQYTCEQQKGWGKCNEWWMKGHCESVCGVCGSTSAPNPAPTSATGGFQVRGRHLYDRCGEKVILRGVNEMIIWAPSGTDGRSLYPEIAKTGANTVRIVWNGGGSAGQLDQTIQNALSSQLIPMVENHDATGDIYKVRGTVDYWTRSDIVSVLKKYDANLLLNIANEAGATNVADDVFKSVYKEAIARIRGTGIKAPLIIDATAWGQNTAQLFRVGAEIFQSDPLRNVMFSAHLYDGGGVTADKVYRLADQISAWAYPLIIGEFAVATPGVCNQRTDYRAILAASQQREISWLPWSWGGARNLDCGDDFNMGNGSLNSLSGWGLEVSVTDPNSIRNTSRRPRSITTGSCQ
jgi:mannan endo-1,4-beta-mannosidase